MTDKLDIKTQKVIVTLLKDNKLSQREIAKKYGVSEATIRRIKNKHKVVRKSEADEEHVKEQAVAIQKVKADLVSIKAKEVERLTPNEVIELFTRSETEEQTKQIVQGIQSALNRMMKVDFPTEKTSFDKDDYCKLKIATDVAEKTTNMLIGLGDPLLPAELEEAKINSIAIPTNQYFGNGKVIDVTD